MAVPGHRRHAVRTGPLSGSLEPQQLLWVLRVQWHCAYLNLSLLKGPG
jgi:hypothetical protein